MTSLIPRRPIRAALATAISLTALAACGAANDGTDDSSESTSSAAEAWSYTDDTGQTIELDSRPTRIAAFADQALALLAYGIEPVAIFGRVDVASDPRFADYDLSDVAIVGNSYGEIDLDALAATTPELVVTGIYPTDREGTLATDGPFYGLADAEQQKQMEKFTSIAAIEIGGEGLAVMERTADLAEQLGADEEGVAEAKAEFDTAAQSLTQAAEAHPEIELTQLYADTEGIYVVKVEDEPVTQMYHSLGAHYTDLRPDGPFYWDIYSWENAAKMMTGDVLLISAEGLQADDLTKQPTFADHPALQADQMHSWAGSSLDYASQADQIDRLVEIIETSQDVA